MQALGNVEHKDGTKIDTPSLALRIVYDGADLVQGPAQLKTSII